MLTRLMAISAARSGGANWERMWAGGLAPGEAFDAAQPELALQALIPGSGITGLSPSTQGSLQLHGKRVLVPGCGRGYAVEALARGGAAAVTGLEVAPTAVQRANEYLEHATAGTDFSNSWSVVEGDFFALETESGGKAHAGYDVVYDCTVSLRLERIYTEYNMHASLTTACSTRPRARSSCAPYPQLCGNHGHPQWLVS